MRMSFQSINEIQRFLSLVAYDGRLYLRTVLEACLPLHVTPDHVVHHEVFVVIPVELLCVGREKLIICRVSFWNKTKMKYVLYDQNEAIFKQ